jgi:hypothetical protein
MCSWYTDEQIFDVPYSVNAENFQKGEILNFLKLFNTLIGILEETKGQEYFKNSTTLNDRQEVLGRELILSGLSAIAFTVVV